MPHTGSMASARAGTGLEPVAIISPLARLATRSAITATAISALATAPRSSPAGACTLSSSAAATPRLRRWSSTVDARFSEAINPT